MSEKKSNNKRIAKNTIALYIRMLILMVISLFTTRVILQALGVSDYGVYNVVGGIVALFSMLSQSLSTANSRFLNFEMGRGNDERLKTVFSTGVTIQIALAIVIAVVTEIAGTWFLNNKLVIPAERLAAANWVFQFSIITFCINLISVPYNAAIIAHEKMSAFAYISIYEGIGKLLICYFVMISPVDKLITYSALACLVQLSVRCIYSAYCKKHFEECIYHFIYDRQMLSEIFGYAGWNFIGASAAVLRTQGGNILINLFAGPAVNAARGVANQVNHAVSGFANNFMTAVKPQITKSYAAGNIKYMTTLVNQSARLSYYMLLFLSLPIIVNIDFILHVWLKTVPERTTIFVILTIVFTLLESFSNPLITAQLATGKVRNYQLIVGGINILNLPFSYLLLRLGFPPEVFLCVAVFFSIVCLFVRLIMLQLNIGFEIIQFIKNVIINCTLVSIISIAIPYFVSRNLSSSWASFSIVVILCILSCCLSIYFIGCSKMERNLVNSKLRRLVRKINK